MSLRDLRPHGDTVCLVLCLCGVTAACSTAGPGRTLPEAAAPGMIEGAENIRQESPAQVAVAESAEQVGTWRFAVIGDFGKGNTAERKVADLVKGWSREAAGLELVLTTGDNNYDSLSVESYLRNVCGPSRNDQYYGAFVQLAPGICKASGSSCSASGECCSLSCSGGRCTGEPVCSASENRFFPTPGNHDFHGAQSACHSGTRAPGASCSSSSDCCSQKCLDGKCAASAACQELGNGDLCCQGGSLYSAYGKFFPEAVFPGARAPLSGSDLYYDFTYVSSGGGPSVKLYAFNSNCAPADSGGCSASGNHGCPKAGSGDCQEQYEIQAARIQEGQAGSRADWSLVYFHQPPYAISRHEGCYALKELAFEDPARYKDANGRGLAAVFSGHAHNYERFTTPQQPDVPFLVVGSSGQTLDVCDPSKVTSDMSSALCAETYGAMLVTVSRNELKLDFYSVDREFPQDSCVISRAGTSQRLICSNAFPEAPQSVCADVQTCSDIHGTDCGWCVESNRAYLGTQNGGPTHTYCSNWIWDHEDCDCAGITSCSGIYRTNCGWCVDTNSAAPGDEDHPLYLSCRNWIWDSDDCNCAGITTCSDIHNTQCGWCVDTDSAAPGVKDEGPTYSGLNCSDWIWRASDCPAS